MAVVIVKGFVQQKHFAWAESQLVQPPAQAAIVIAVESAAQQCLEVRAAEVHF